MSCSHSEHELIADITAAYYRSGLVLSEDWRTVANVISSFDDVIIGVDTNIMLDAALSEQILSSFFLADPREYVHTPNWVLIVIPNAVIHELEQAANSRGGNHNRNDSRLTKAGRIGYRALEEMVELNRSADISGVSIMVVGNANPVLDTQVELRGLRADFSRTRRDPQGDYENRESPKKSSSDMMIRAQYKEFLRQIDFHKGIFFLTADKSNAALARAEGLHAIYYKPPPPNEARKQVRCASIPCDNSIPVTLAVPIGKLLYELSVQFGNLTISWPEGAVELSCDRKGETLNHWLHRELKMQKGLDSLLALYAAHARVPLHLVRKTWGEITDLLLGSETIIGWGKPERHGVKTKAHAQSIR